MSASSKYAYLDVAQLVFPLILRKWELGDYMYPFGLTKESGKPSKKKIGKILRDQKLSQQEKEDTWVLCSGDKIVWLLGHRLDERFKVTATTQEVFELELK
jgi:tRNA(Ile)-lysidine synthase